MLEAWVYGGGLSDGGNAGEEDEEDHAQRPHVRRARHEVAVQKDLEGREAQGQGGGGAERGRERSQEEEEGRGGVNRRWTAIQATLTVSFPALLTLVLPCFLSCLPSFFCQTYPTFSIFSSRQLILIGSTEWVSE